MSTSHPASVLVEIHPRRVPRRLFICEAQRDVQLGHDLTMQWHHDFSVPELDLLLKTQRDWLVGRLEASRKPRGALADFPRMAEYIREAFPDNEYINSQYRVLA